jgi:tRNA modification GTPase
MNAPIIALATPPLNSALALLRCSGDGVFALADQFFDKKVSGVNKRSILIGYLKDQGKTIDQVVLLVYPGPNTMTGEDILEICCHGSMLIVDEIVQAFCSRGARYAGRGEFSSRAFYNGKMDLIEAEAINDVINATTKESKNLALLSLSGETSKLLLPIKEEIASLLALLEVNIDYPEYTDIEEANSSLLESKAKEIRAHLSSLIEHGEEGRIIREGVKVALVGAPNAGKSSLLNAMLGEEKAIVSSLPGTTRDIVEGEISVKGVPLHLLDTAGIRSSFDEIESLGVERSKKAIAEADLVILVVDGSKGLSEQDDAILKEAKGKKAIVCYNKSDLIYNKDIGKVYVSAINNDVSSLKKAIYSCLSLSESSFVTPSFSNARELSLLRLIDGNLKEVEEEARNGVAADLISIPLQEAYHNALRLLGFDPGQDLSEEIFSRFCVGK